MEKNDCVNHTVVFLPPLSHGAEAPLCLLKPNFHGFLRNNK